MRRYNITEENRKSIFLNVALLLLLFAFLFVLGRSWRAFLAQRNVNVEDLRVFSETALIQNADQVLVSGERIYVPAEGKGTYFIERTLNPSLTVVWQLMGIPGRTLAGVSATGGQGIYILPEKLVLVEVETGLEKPFYNYDSTKFKFSTPCFYPEHDFILFTRENLSTPAHDKEIVKINLSTGELLAVTKGERPSIDNRAKKMVFAREGNIYHLDLKTNKEEFLTAGLSPAGSENFDYIAYLHPKEPEVYVMAANRPDSKTKITANVKKTGSDEYLYRYGAPVWDPLGKTLYVPRLHTETNHWNINRYVLGYELPEAEQAAAEWLEGVIGQDQEIIYRYYPSYKQEIAAPINNDALLGYRFLDVSLKEGGLYIRMEQLSTDEIGNYYIRQYDMQADNQDEGYRFYQISEKKHKKYIIEPERIRSEGESNEEKIVLTEGSNVLMTVYNPDYKSIIYLVDTPNGYAVKMYDTVPRQTENLPGAISTTARPLSLSLSENGHVLALFYQEDNIKNVTMYNLKKRSVITAPFMQNVQKIVWVGDQILVHCGNEDISLRWCYEPSQGVIKL